MKVDNPVTTNAGGKKECFLQSKNQEQTENPCEVCGNKVSYGQFSSGEELFKAYKSLQSQFTKRSQRLKEVERENERLKEQSLCGENYIADETGKVINLTDGETVQDETGSGVAQPSRCEKGDSFDGREEFLAAEAERFLSLTPEAADYAVRIAAKAAEKGNADSGFLERAFISVLVAELADERQRNSDDEYLFEKARKTPAVKERLIREYLWEITKNPSATLITAEGQTATTPPLKPKDIEEAGKMAAGMLKRK